MPSCVTTVWTQLQGCRHIPTTLPLRPVDRTVVKHWQRNTGNVRLLFRPALGTMREEARRPLEYGETRSRGRRRLSACSGGAPTAEPKQEAPAGCPAVGYRARRIGRTTEPATACHVPGVRQACAMETERPSAGEPW